ncbi:MAG: UPF0149 family protein [Gammaproteobacteria bacterium]|mgnify:CR=1 FL=1|uniref:UPF0149 family protein n=1 Tax=Azohydromonas sp. TaxID=1872666 RepID=UPI002BFE14C9|nr:UPF0149 family protein [Azohydromonas sp.]HMM86229.1 UPF0149 family protein [Azohydromonas sp.]
MATALVPHSSDAEIEHLNTLCRRLAGFKHDVSLEWVDGFMTALLASPRRVPPEQWLPAMLDDAFDRAFADPDDRRQALDALVGRWQVIARQLDPEALLDDPEALRLSPLIVDYSDEVRAELAAEGRFTDDEIAQLPANGTVWADGFVDALEAFAGDWPEPDRTTEHGRFYDDCLMGVIALTLTGADLDAYLADRYPGQTLDRDDLIDEACYCVQDLRVYWLDHAPTHAPIRVAPRPGRNDPCPCGSGRKYKKCCGAGAG